MVILSSQEINHQVFIAVGYELIMNSGLGPAYCQSPNTDHSISVTSETRTTYTNAQNIHEKKQET
jgi:hypothetical protein